MGICMCSHENLWQYRVSIAKISCCYVLCYSHCITIKHSCSWLSHDYSIILSHVGYFICLTVMLYRSHSIIWVETVAIEVFLDWQMVEFRKHILRGSWLLIDWPITDQGLYFSSQGWQSRKEIRPSPPPPGWNRVYICGRKSNAIHFQF